MVGDVGLEPTTPCSQSTCASQLRQSPKCRKSTVYGQEFGNSFILLLLLAVPFEVLCSSLVGLPFEAKENKSEKGTVHPTLKRASEDILRFAKNGGRTWT